jgi:glycerol-3-phosphate dehydrogenase
LIYADPRNVTFVAGGKYTTYRRMAEHTVEVALQNFTIEEQVRFKNNNTETALNPLATPDKFNEAHRQIKSWAKQSGWSEEAVRILVDRHGFEASDVLEHMSSINAATEAERLWGAELRHAVRYTMCTDLISFYVRRAPLFLSFKDHGLSLVLALGRVMQEELGWSDSQRQAQERSVQEYVQKELGWKQAFGINSASF